MKNYKVVTPATSNIMTTSDVKSHLKVDTTADDTLISNLLVACTNSAQEYTNRFFMATTLDMFATRIFLKPNQSFPNLSERKNAIEVRYVVGAASVLDVDDAIKQAVLLQIGNLYQNRESVVTGTIATELPMNSKFLLDQYKIQVCV
jgi:hypothetical protein